MKSKLHLILLSVILLLIGIFTTINLVKKKKNRSNIEDVLNGKDITEAFIDTLYFEKAKSIKIVVSDLDNGRINNLSDLFVKFDTLVNEIGTPNRKKKLFLSTSTYYAFDSLGFFMMASENGTIIKYFLCFQHIDSDIGSHGLFRDTLIVNGELITHDSSFEQINATFDLQEIGPVDEYYLSVGDKTIEFCFDSNSNKIESVKISGG